MSPVPCRVSPSALAAASHVTDRLVRVPRLADRSYGAGGRPGRGGSHRSERPEYDTTLVVGSQGKNTTCSGWSCGATATCCYAGIVGCPRSIHLGEWFVHRSGAVCPRLSGGSPRAAWRLSTGCTQNMRSIVARWRQSPPRRQARILGPRVHRTDPTAESAQIGRLVPISLVPRVFRANPVPEAAPHVACTRGTSIRPAPGVQR
jgi:hypothetical protein